MKLKLYATDKDLMIKASERLISGSVNMYTCEFTFDESWDGYTVTAVFSTNGSRLVNMAVVDGKCQIPHEVLRPNARIRVGIFGTDGVRSRPTTYSDWITVEQGADVSGNTAQPPTPSIYEQWMGSLVEKNEEWESNEQARIEAEQAREDLETGYVAQAKSSAESAKASEAAAAASAKSAESCAELAASEANRATSEANRATSEANRAEEAANRAEDFYEVANELVPNTRKINNKDLSSDISLTAADVGAVPKSQLDATDLGITAVRKFNTFADIPNGNGLLHCYVLVGSTPDPDCPYPTDVTMWWDILQIGFATRQTQICVQTYSSRPGKDEMWCRTKHDSTWSKWTRINVVGDLVTAVPHGGKFELINADHKWLTSYRDSTVPNVPMVSHYTHIVGYNADGAIKSVLSIPWDYTDTMYQYSGKSKKWFAIATTDYVDAKNLTVTVDGNTASHTTAQIYDHVNGGGSVTLKYGGDIYNFVAYDEVADAAAFLNVDQMDGEYIQNIAIRGTKVSYWRLTPATKDELAQKVSNPSSASVGQTIVVKTVDEDGKPTEWEAVDLPSGGGASTMIVTVDNGKTSHTHKQIINHVKSGGMAVLKMTSDDGDMVCNFIACDEDLGWVSFVGADRMEGNQYHEYLVEGSSVEERMLKSVDDILVGKKIFPETYFEGTGEEYSSGSGWEWNCAEGLFFNIEEPLVEGKTYSVTIDGDKYKLTAKKPARPYYSDDELVLEVEDLFEISYFGYSEEWESYNTCFWPDWWDEWGEDGPLMQSITIGIEGDPVVSNEYLDIFRDGSTIFPETYFEGTGKEFSRGDGWEWDGVECGLFFNIEEPLMEGKTYSVIVNGVLYTAVAKKDDVGVPSLRLTVPDKFTMWYFLGDYPGFETFNTCFSPYFWEEEGEDGLLMQSVSIGIGVPTTIKNEYLDMGAIVAAVKAALGI